MGNNASKTVTTTVVENAIIATVTLELDTSNTASAGQELTISHNSGGSVDRVNMNQNVKVSTKSQSMTTAAKDFQSKITTDLKEHIKQATETGALSNQNATTITETVQKFALDCSAAFTIHLSQLISAHQKLTITENYNTHVRNIIMRQDLESLAESLAETIVNDKTVVSSASKIDKTVDQKAEGFASILGVFAGVWQNIAIAIAAIVVVVLIGGLIFVTQ